jgi:hypothetical protein
MGSNVRSTLLLALNQAVGGVLEFCSTFFIGSPVYDQFLCFFDSNMDLFAELVMLTQGNWFRNGPCLVVEDHLRRCAGIECNVNGREILGQCGY